eukprot:TRINITY_DN3561_c0_g1_i30.p1 TRINITY_DN3561_c0_g1~~TRINITY_DN3561_c0_g1_i30.p1  ORF type:complete len:905 (-),score=165.61 TRINITY_DN3561_c0_g1_i30:175-2889(-)
MTSVGRSIVQLLHASSSDFGKWATDPTALSAALLSAFESLRNFVLKSSDKDVYEQVVYPLLEKLSTEEKKESRKRIFRVIQWLHLSERNTDGDSVLHSSSTNQQEKAWVGLQRLVLLWALSEPDAARVMKLQATHCLRFLLKNIPQFYSETIGRKVTESSSTSIDANPSTLFDSNELILPGSARKDTMTPICELKSGPHDTRKTISSTLYDTISMRAYVEALIGIANSDPRPTLLTTSAVEVACSIMSMETKIPKFQWSQELQRLVQALTKWYENREILSFKSLEFAEALVQDCIANDSQIRDKEYLACVELCSSTHKAIDLDEAQKRLKDIQSPVIAGNTQLAALEAMRTLAMLPAEKRDQILPTCKSVFLRILCAMVFDECYFSLFRPILKVLASVLPDADQLIVTWISDVLSSFRGRSDSKNSIVLAISCAMEYFCNLSAHLLAGPSPEDRLVIGRVFVNFLQTTGGSPNHMIQDWKSLVDFASDCFLSPDEDLQKVGSDILHFSSMIDAVNGIMSCIQKYNLLHRPYITTDIASFLGRCDPKECMLVIIDYLRNLPHSKTESPAITNPGEIQGILKPTENKNWQPYHDFMLSVVESWLNTSTLEDIAAAGTALAQKMFSSPDDAVAVKLSGRLSVALSKSSQTMATLIHQELLRHSTIPWESWPKDEVIFHKLSPLLLMRVMPSSFYPAHTLNEIEESLWIDLSRILMQMSFDNLETDDLRRLATELVARFPCRFHHKEMMKHLHSSLKDERYNATKTCIYYMCSAIAWHSENIKVVSTDYLDAIFRVVSYPSFSQPTDLQKAQTGCVDALALLGVHIPQGEFRFCCQGDENPHVSTIQNVMTSLLALVEVQISKQEQISLFLFLSKEYGLEVCSDSFKTYLLNTFIRQLAFISTSEVWL